MCETKFIFGQVKGFFIKLFSNSTDKLNNEHSVYFEDFKATVDLLIATFQNYWINIFCEFLATFMFIFIGSASSVQTTQYNVTSDLNSALGFGFTVTGVTQTFGHISGCHINPVITLAFIIAKEYSVALGVLYVAAQFCGAIVGLGLLWLCLPSSIVYAGVTDIHEDMNPFQGLLIEIILTFHLVLIILSLWNVHAEFKISPAVATGLAVASSQLAGYKFTGASMNPAKSFGAALINGYWKHHWIFWLGPIAGSVMASLIYILITTHIDTNETIDF